MWTIIKFDKKSFKIFKDETSKILGKNCKFYRPQIILQKYKNNKIINFKIDLLNDYVFCYDEKFKEKEIFKYLKYTKGLKYFLEGFRSSQKEINNFINYCKSLENENGLITKNFFDNYINISRDYKFLSGPFLNKVFKVISVQRNKLRILVGGLNTTIRKDEFLFNPV